MIDGRTVFDDYILWEGRKRLDEYDNKRRNERVYNFSVSDRESLKCDYQAIISKGVLYLEKTHRDKFSEWVYILRLYRILNFQKIL